MRAKIVRRYERTQHEDPCYVEFLSADSYGFVLGFEELEQLGDPFAIVVTVEAEVASGG